MEHDENCICKECMTCAEIAHLHLRVAEEKARGDRLQQVLDDMRAMLTKDQYLEISDTAYTGYLGGAAYGDKPGRVRIHVNRRRGTSYWRVGDTVEEAMNKVGELT